MTSRWHRVLARTGGPAHAWSLQNPVVGPSENERPSTPEGVQSRCSPAGPMTPRENFLVFKLTQLAQLEVSFGDFTRIGVSRVNGLAVGEGRFERVVATLGIFFLGGSGCDGACICATRFAGRTARFTVTGAWFAVFVSGGASFSRRWRSSASSMSAVVLKHGRWRAS